MAVQQLAFGGEDHIPKGYKLLYEQTFESPESMNDFVMTDPKAWKYAKEEKGGALELAAQSQYKPEVRSPVNIALIKDKVFGDFILEADLVESVHLRHCGVRRVLRERRDEVAELLWPVGVDHEPDDRA